MTEIPAELLALVHAQAEDAGLWFVAQTAPEAYLQQELRKLHAAVEAHSAHAGAAAGEAEKVRVGVMPMDKWREEFFSIARYCPEPERESERARLASIIGRLCNERRDVQYELDRLRAARRATQPGAEGR